MVKNPTLVTFSSPDHEHPELSGYEIDIVAAGGAVIQTIAIAKPSTSFADGKVSCSVNVQPVSFGVYTVACRAVAGAIKSDASAPSETWQRAPGSPSKPAVL